MAGPKGSRYYDIFLKHQVQLVTGDETLITEEGFRLLTEVGKTGSIVAGAKNVGMSYRKAWGLIRQIDYNLGFMLAGKKRGGKAGGRTSLTPEGEELLEAYQKLLTELESTDREAIRTFFRRINHITDGK
jgi:molybdate transport system regulatory protein